MKIQTIKTKLVDCWDTVVDVLYGKPYRVFRNIQLKIRDAWWLITKGFKPDHTWDLAVWFCSIAPKLLEHMIKHSCSCPLHDIVNLGRSQFPELFPTGSISVEAGDKLDPAGNSIDYVDWTRILQALAHLIRNSNINTQTAYKNDVDVVGEVYTTSPYISKNGVGLRSINFCKNDSFKQWCDRENEIQANCDANFKRAMPIFVQLLPYLWY